MALLLPFLVLAGLEGVARLVAGEAPRSKLLLQAQSYRQDFNPFITTESGWKIRPEWTGSGDLLRLDPSEGDEGEVVLLPTFRPAELSSRPAADHHRVFAFGGSTTFGLGVGKQAAFPAQLEGLLRQTLGSGSVEVINLGCPGWASDRIVFLAHQALDMGADLLILYAGHNEMLERPDLTVSSGFLPSASLWLLERSVLFGWLHHRLFQGQQDASDSESEQELGRRIQSKVYEPQLTERHLRQAISDTERDQAQDRYRRSLEALADAAEQRGVPVIFVVPVSNVFTPPQFSHDSDSDRGEVWVARLRDAWTDLRSGRPEGVLAKSRAVAEEAPTFAMAHFLLGLGTGILHSPEAALPHLQRAIDLDHHTHRITTPMEAVLRSVAAEKGIPLVDPRQELRQPLSLDTAGRRILDHCHPTALGHRMLAEEIAPHALTALQP